MATQLYHGALLAGERTWKEGLRKSGNCLVHGITGNAYMLWNIHNTFSDLAKKGEKNDKEKYKEISDRYRTRAYMFAKALGDLEV